MNTVNVNGRSVALTAATMLEEVVEAELARALGPRSSGTQRGIAVAVNSDVVPRRDWPSTPVHEGDQVEILTAVPGG